MTVPAPVQIPAHHQGSRHPSPFLDDHVISQDFSETFKLELGFERTLRVLESKNSEEETIIDVRLFADDQPTEKGQVMTLSRWRILCDNVEQIEQNWKK